MDRTQQASARQFFAQAEKLELQLPKAVIQARARVEKICVGMEAIPPHDLAGVANAVSDALGHGADVLTDSGVQKAIALSIITQPNVVNYVEDVAFSRVWEACEEYQDEIVAELRKPFDKAAETLVLAHKAIGDLDLKDDAEAILKKGGSIAETWAGAVAAQKVIDSTIVAWDGLDRFIHEGTLDRRWISLRLVSPTAEIFDANDWGRVAVTPWDAVRAGVELSLPTRSEYVQRRATLTEQRAEILAAASREKPRPSYLTH